MFGFGKKKKQKEAAVEAQGESRKMMEDTIANWESQLAAGNTENIPVAQLPLLLVLAQSIPNNADILARLNKIAKAKGITLMYGKNA
jgi:hypothetical protein